MSLDEKHICTFSKKEQGPKRDDTASQSPLSCWRKPRTAGLSSSSATTAFDDFADVHGGWEDQGAASRCPPPKGIGFWVLGPKVFVFIGLYQHFTLGVIPRVCQRLYFHWHRLYIGVIDFSCKWFNWLTHGRDMQERAPQCFTATCQVISLLTSDWWFDILMFPSWAHQLTPIVCIVLAESPLRFTWNLHRCQARVCECLKFLKGTAKKQISDILKKKRRAKMGYGGRSRLWIFSSFCLELMDVLKGLCGFTMIFKIVCTRHPPNIQS